MGSGRIWVALGVAAAAHAACLWLWPIAERPVRQPIELTLEFETPLPPLPPPETPKPAVQPAVVAEEIPPEPSVPAAETAALEEIDPAPQPPPALDLTRPEVWPDNPPQEPVDEMVLAFRPELHEGLIERRAEQARAGVLDERRIAVAGLTPDEYNAQGINPFVFKTEQGCFRQRMDLDGRVIGARRWWRVSCNEILENPLLLPALEYDALGRAVGLSDL